MVTYATQYWEQGQAGGHVNKVADGKAQAEKIEPHFRAIATQWFKRVEAVA